MNEFKGTSEPTLAAAFMTKTIEHNGETIKFNVKHVIYHDILILIQIWDTAGQEKYHSLAPMYYRDADIAIVVYDITNRQSYTVLETWMMNLKEDAPSDISTSNA